MVEPKDVVGAAERIAGQVVRTPLAHSRTLSDICKAEIWLKLETLQFTASFKERGALNRLLTLTPEQRARGVIALSAGNHAQGVAYHARRMGVPAVILMPRFTPITKVENTRVHGAEVVLGGDSFDACWEQVQHIRAERGLTLIHPYDDPYVIAGQGTIGLEMLEARPDLDALVTPVGGGGLISGLCLAAEALGSTADIYGVEVDAFPCVHHRLKGLAMPEPSFTVAEGIAVREPGGRALPIIERRVREMVLVGEPDVEAAVLALLEIEKRVAEGAGAAGLAWLLGRPEALRGRRVGVVISGGNIDLPVLGSIIQRGMARDGRLARFTVSLPDVPGALARVARCVADSGGNVVEVHHQRSFTLLTARQTELEMVVLTRGAPHREELMQALREAGYVVTCR